MAWLDFDVTTKDILDAIKGTYGIQVQIARKLGVSRFWIQQRIKESPEIQTAISQERETLVDEAEGGLANKINQGSLSAIKYTLSRLGKERGYTERIDIRQGGMDGSPLQVRFEEVDDWRGNVDVSDTEDAPGAEGSL